VRPVRDFLLYLAWDRFADGGLNPLRRSLGTGGFMRDTRPAAAVGRSVSKMIGFLHGREARYGRKRVPMSPKRAMRDVYGEPAGQISAEGYDVEKRNVSCASS